LRTNVQQPVRDHVLLELTRSLCPECKQVIDAQILLRGSKVYMRKHCREHGWSEALISSDADWHVNALRYNKPGAIPYSFATEVRDGCPSDCGLCPEHQQHTCVGVLEITTRCNLPCKTCFATAGSGYDLTVAQVETILDRFVATEGQPEVVQISGGEPTIHPQILEILQAAKERGIRHVMLNTNGVRFAQDRAFVQQLAELNPTIYLQFDGLQDSIYQALRGVDLLWVKETALENLAEAGMNVVLVTTVVQGINDGALGDVLRFALEHKAVRGVSFQPATFAGRCLEESDPLSRTTVPDVLHALEQQSKGLFCVSDFIPVPCPYPTCTACTYAYVDGDEVVPIPRIIEVDDYLDYVTNRTAPDISTELRPVLESLWSMAALIGSETTTDSLACCTLDLPTPSDLQGLSEHFFAIQVHGFMDEHNFDLKRLMKCCIHTLLPDGRAMPMCAYNNLGYREQVRREQEAAQ
jgi:7,8-dihydro-6-hydroxymethylpterin dimethyltransferase